ncbi:hypothetical protein EDD53_1079 [Pacificibacter maritimus]|uniref:MAPEG family protein n=1 Tax=Pacificibacter maritimus TaxID=762213 RepID=A0A3N4UMQ8_9RHOB|nr:MAPEG family protein [Pacificibacter maritimus]RPE71946.1 hypothetical protein EDD53_1079 [Pacificibacter maritimus]
MLPITSVTASLAVVIYIALAFRIIAIRRAKRVSLGTADSDLLETRVRQHGNFNEYAPLTLLLMGLAEFQGAAALWIAVLGIGFLASRVLHIFGLEWMHKPIGLKLRTYGVLSCFAILMALALTLTGMALF